MKTDHFQFPLPALSGGFSKSSLSAAAEMVVTEVIDNGKMADAAEAISAMDVFIKKIKSDPRFTESVREEVLKSGKSFTSASGTKIELAETGTRYDYSFCGHEGLVAKQAQFDKLSNDITEIQDFLKKIKPEGILITDETTGETYKCYPPSKSSASSYKVTLST